VAVEPEDGRNQKGNSMREIQLTKGKVALVSDSDYEFLSQKTKEVAL
jgi:hypothetical protein